MAKNYSGVAEYAANLLAAILDIDKDNEYRLFYNSSRNLDEHLKSWNRRNAKVIACHFPNKIFNYFLESFCGYPKIDKLLGGAEIFYSPNFNFTRLSKNCLSVITVHDLSFFRYPEFFSLSQNIWHRALMIRKILAKADVIVAVSENTKRDIIELMGIPAEKIKIIYSGIAAPLKDIGQEKQRYFLSERGINSRFILYLGTIEPRKNISGLIAAYNLFRDKHPNDKTQLVLAGGRGWKTKKIYNTWKQSPYQADIKFLDYVSREEKAILYQTASLFTYVSFYEGFGFPPLEAMSYDLPVVCSNASSLPEVVEDAAITVDPYNISAISRAIELGLNDQNLRIKLIAQGKERFKEFTWEKSAQKYLEVFKSLCQK